MIVADLDQDGLDEFATVLESAEAGCSLFLYKNILGAYRKYQPGGRLFLVSLAVAGGDQGDRACGRASVSLEGGTLKVLDNFCKTWTLDRAFFGDPG